MDFLTDWLTNWLKELLISGIMGNLEGLFDTVNAKVGEIAVQVGTTPAAWNAGVFSLIRQLSEMVILPIAGLVLTFVATYELIQMLLEKNNMHEFDVANIYKWVFKTACAILILSNTFNIVMAVFDVSQSVIADAAGLIQGSTDITPDMLTEDGKYIRMERVTDLPFIILKKGHAIRRAVDRLFRDCGATPNVIMETTSNINAVQLANSGYGATIVPERAISLEAEGAAD